MATQGDYTAGYDAAYVVAEQAINQLVPAEFDGFIPQEEVRRVVWNMTIAAVNAVDAYRATNPAPPPPSGSQT